MSKLKRAWLGLGSNLDDPIQQIMDARVQLLALTCVHGWQCSIMYQSSPVGFSDQPNFINCVLVLDVDIEATELFSEMRFIETNLGRVRDDLNQNAPRKIDIDLLLFDDQVSDKPELIIPHPRMTQRLFVLEPLSELGLELERDAKTDFSQQTIHQLTV